jgi:hypothetical protein
MCHIFIDVTNILLMCQSPHVLTLSMSLNTFQFDTCQRVQVSTVNPRLQIVCHVSKLSATCAKTDGRDQIET